jgi:sialate O-acetylesterase
MMARTRLLFAALACLLIPIPSLAEVRLSPLISDGMVLQRGRLVNIWGTGDPGASVTVSFQAQSKTTVTGNDGSWKIAIGPLVSGGPYTLAVSGKNVLKVRDVLVGEVWVCAGQSNMEVGVKTSLNSAQEILAADYPNIRFFTVEKAVAGKPQREVKGEWMTVRPQTVADFSAVGYFFGRALHKVLNVPIGLISNAWGGTTAES